MIKNNNELDYIMDENGEDPDDESLFIHKIINNSSVHKRQVAHPFSASKKTKEVILSKKQIMLNKMYHYLEKNVIDKYVGFFEKRRHKKGKGFSNRAFNEFLSYYKNLYQEEKPDIKAFQRLLIRNGTPDIVNPFNEGNPEYYSYHPLGFVAADLSTLLEGMQSSLDSEEGILDYIEKNAKKERHRDKKEWLTFFDFIEDAEKDKAQEEEEHQHLAMLSWCLILALGDSLDNLKKEVHPDNLEVATIETLLLIDESSLPKSITLKKIADGAVHLGLLNKIMAMTILNQRKDIDESSNLSSIKEKINYESNEKIMMDKFGFKPASIEEVKNKL